MLLANFLRRLTGSLRQNDAFYCPVCRTTSDTFLPFGMTYLRPNAMCPHCRSLERHRLLWLYLEQKTDFFHAHMRVLDVAPQKFLQEKFYTLKNLHYMSVDLHSVLAMEKMDLTNLRIESGTYDCVMCYHVLEHIPDDRKAMREIFRVLKPGGWAILQSPVDLNREKTHEDPSIVLPEERLKHFGQRDHVRWYGRDFVTRLEAAGFSVQRLKLAEELGPVMVKRCSLRQDEILYVCRKPV